MCSDEKGKYDELIDDKGVKVLIDPKAMMHVIGTKMDFVDDKLRYRKHVTPLLHFCISPLYDANWHLQHKCGFRMLHLLLTLLFAVIFSPD